MIRDLEEAALNCLVWRGCNQSVLQIRKLYMSCTSEDWRGYYLQDIHNSADSWVLPGRWLGEWQDEPGQKHCRRSVSLTLRKGSKLIPKSESKGSVAFPCCRSLHVAFTIVKRVISQNVSLPVLGVHRGKERGRQRRSLDLFRKSRLSHRRLVNEARESTIKCWTI